MKIKSHSELPENYIKFSSVNLKEDKKALVFVNVLSLLVIIPFGIILGIIVAFSDLKISSEFKLLNLLHFILQFVVMIALHELVHAVVFKMGTKEKVKFKYHGIYFSASVEGIYFYKRHYLSVGMAPFVVLNAIYIALMLIFPSMFLFWYLLLALHTSSCAGDIYVFFKYIKLPKEALIEDIGVEMRVFLPKSDN